MASYCAKSSTSWTRGRYARSPPWNSPSLWWRISPPFSTPASHTGFAGVTCSKRWTSTNVRTWSVSLAGSTPWDGRRKRTGTWARYLALRSRLITDASSLSIKCTKGSMWLDCRWGPTKGLISLAWTLESQGLSWIECYFVRFAAQNILK